MSEEEIAEIRGRIQASTVSLGPRILRTETAAIASVAALMAVAGEWDIRQ
ncbi:MAG: 16S rRNA (uracil(1498)-N(3))-methyltransferase [Clostridia bacterium]|nr:16S rRNA (uracil(1498)-N(3))-methyltransferase [Clostridia bacterium]